MQNREMSVARRAARENERRVQRAASALAPYDDEVTYDWEATLVDILTDLRHWAAKQKLDFDQCDRIAAGHFAVEHDEASGVPY